MNQTLWTKDAVNAVIVLAAAADKAEIKAYVDDAILNGEW